MIQIGLESTLDYIFKIFFIFYKKNFYFGQPIKKGKGPCNG